MARRELWAEGRAERGQRIVPMGLAMATVFLEKRESPGFLLMCLSVAPAQGAASVPLSWPRQVAVLPSLWWVRGREGGQRRAKQGKSEPAVPAQLRLCPQGGCGKLSVFTRDWKFWGNYNLAVGCEKPRGFTGRRAGQSKSRYATSPGEASSPSGAVPWRGPRWHREGSEHQEQLWGTCSGAAGAGGARLLHPAFRGEACSPPTKPGAGIAGGFGQQAGTWPGCFISAQPAQELFLLRP